MKRRTTEERLMLQRQFRALRRRLRTAERLLSETRAWTWVDPGFDKRIARFLGEL